MKKAPKKTIRRKSDIGLLAIKRVDLSLDLKPLAALDLRSSLEAALKGSRNGSTAQLSFKARELNEIYVYVHVTQMKKIIARLAEIAP